MSQLPDQDRIAHEIYEAALRRDKSSRGYLGMSRIGSPCERALWYEFRGYTPAPREGRVVMIWNLGSKIEEIVIDLLLGAGYRIDGEQTEVSAHDGFFKGHADGIIHGVTARPHVLEVKSAKASKFKAFKQFGVRRTYPVYYSQCQCYMGYLGLERALVVVYNKDTSEIYTERIHFNRSDFDALHQRAYRIITANEPSERAFQDENTMECQWCDWRLQCRHAEEALTMSDDEKCGTCLYLWFNGLKPWCFHPDHPVQIKTWGTRCDEYINEVRPEPNCRPRLSQNEVLKHAE